MEVAAMSKQGIQALAEILEDLETRQILTSARKPILSVRKIELTFPRKNNGCRQKRPGQKGG
jgi:hypothetical protein